MGISIKELQKTHKKYRPDLIRTYSDIYEGGEAFEENRETYLRFRPSEKTSAGKAQRKSRVDSSSYNNITAGLVDWLSQCVVQNPPCVLAKPKTPPEPVDPKKPIDPKKDPLAFWHKLNDATDGTSNLSALVRAELLELLVQGRSYIYVEFPDGVENETVEARRERGGLDARLTFVGASEVDHWQKNSKGEYVWIRTHCVEEISPDRYSAATIERHTWIYHSNTETETFIAERDIKKKSWPEGMMVEGVVKPHSLGAIPLIPLELERGLHLLNRIKSTALALYNRQNARSYSLDTQCFAQPVSVLPEGTTMGNAQSSENVIMTLPVQGTFEFKVPAVNFEAIRQDVSDLKDELFGSVQATILSAAQKTQSPRQSAKAKAADFEGLEILLGVFASTLIDALEKAVEMIRVGRNDEQVELVIDGLNGFSGNATPENIAMAQSFLALPGITETARKWVLESTSLQVCNGAPANIREQIKAEIAAQKPPEKVPEQHPAQENPGPGPKEETENKQTEQESENNG